MSSVNAFADKAKWFESTVMSYNIHAGTTQRDQALDEIGKLRAMLNKIEAEINDREQELIARGFKR